MRHCGKYFITALAACLCLALASAGFALSRGVSVQTKAGQPVKLYQDYAALVIGVSEYKYWPKLPGAIQDAQEVAAALKKMGFKVILVRNPDSNTLAGLLKRLPYNQGKPRDRALLIYFAGHGATESLADGSKMGYIVPTDCPLPGRDPAGFAELGISMRRFEDLALRVKCRHVLMAFDSCFSGSLFALGRAAPQDISEKIARPVRQFVTAGNENEEVPDKSTFKQVFIDGIGGEADYDRDGYVTGSELGMYLQKQVVNYTRGAQHPQYGKIRNPKLDKGDFVFRLAGGPGTTPRVKPPPPPPAPPQAPKPDDLQALEEEAKRRKAWAAWQERMDQYWQRMEKLDGSSLPAAKKTKAWRGALRSFADDNPFSVEDEALRKRGRERAAYWARQAELAARPKRQPSPPAAGGQKATPRFEPGFAPAKIKICGGPTGGTFNMFAGGMATYVPRREPKIQCTAVGSGGSVANVRRVNRGDCDVALSYGGDLWLGAHGKLPKDARRYDDVRVMGFLYGAPAQLVVHAGSGIKSARDLVGRRVAIGNAGSGAAAAGERFFRHLGIWSGIKLRFMGYSASARGFLDNKLDAFWLLVGYPNRSVIEASVASRIRLINLDDDARRSGLYQALPFYHPVTIPAGTYYRGQPRCRTFQDAAYLTVRKSLPAGLVYRLMSILWSPQGMREMTNRRKTFKAMNLENNFRGAAIKLHPGAIRFWRENGIRVPAKLQ